MARSATLTVMIKAVEKAARGLKRDFGEVENLQVSRKGPGDFVSTADRNAENTLYEELRKARPDFAFLMEESGAKGKPEAEDRWIIDPLDGTNNFLHGIPHWAISLAWEHRVDIVAGVVYDPIKDELFFAEKGSGAFLNSRRLRVSARRTHETAIAVTEIGRATEAEQSRLGAQTADMGNILASVRRTGSAALDLAYVAAGRFEFFWCPGIEPWDFAAGRLLVTEAGGETTRLDGKKLTTERGSLLASNGRLHRFALTRLAGVPS